MPGATKTGKAKEEDVFDVIHWKHKGKPPRVSQPVVDKWKHRITKDLTSFGMPDSVPFFHRMADLQFFTTESQDGKVDRGPLPLDFSLYTDVSTAIMKRKKDPKKTFTELVHDMYQARGGRFAAKPQVTMTERAYLIGFMPPDVAELFHYLVNLSTDLVCVCSNKPSVPMTYDLGSMYVFSNDHPLYGKIHGGTKLKLQPSFRRLWASGVLPKEISKLEQVMVFDPRHGRAAQRHMYPLASRCLEKADALLEFHHPRKRRPTSTVPSGV
jgi:hypothetical protein